MFDLGERHSNLVVGVGRTASVSVLPARKIWDLPVVDCQDERRLVSQINEIIRDEEYGSIFISRISY